MEELGVRPNIAVVQIIGDVFKELGMLDKYEKLHQKYPPPRWQYRYIRGRRVKIKVQGQPYQVNKYREENENVEPNSDLDEDDRSEETSDVIDEQFEQDANAITMESEQTSDDSFDSREPVFDV